MFQRRVQLDGYATRHWMHAWLIYVILHWISGALGFCAGRATVAAAGLPDDDVAASRTTQTWSWRLSKWIAAVIGVVLSAVFDIGGRQRIDTWLEFSWKYGDPILRIGAVTLVIGPMCYVVLRLADGWRLGLMGGGVGRSNAGSQTRKPPAMCLRC